MRLTFVKENTLAIEHVSPATIPVQPKWGI
jgi:hypothetical protein